MIKFEKGKFEAKGTYADLMADFVFIVNSLLIAGMKGGLSESFAKEKLKKHFEIGLLPKEEMVKALKEYRAEIEKEVEEDKKELVGLLKELLKEMEGEE